MADTVRVGSRLLVDLLLPLPGTAGESFVVRGVSHPTTDGMVVTEGVPAEAFDRWMAENALYEPVANRMIFALPDDFDAKPVPKEYGFQPALDRLAEDGEQRKLAEQGAPNDDPVAQPVSRAGLAVPLPDPLPEPPKEATITRAVPQAQPTEQVRVPVHAPQGFVPSSDDPKQDINLRGPGLTGSPSSNQLPAANPANPLGATALPAPGGPVAPAPVAPAPQPPMPAPGPVQGPGTAP